MQLHTLNTTQNNKLHRHHDLPCLTASRDLNFIDECDPHIRGNRSQSPQHGNVIFIDETNLFFILLTFILQASEWRARKLKVSFFSDYLCCFLAVALKQRALTTAICWYSFADVYQDLIMFCHDFVLGGGSAMLAMFTLSLAAQVGCAL